MKNILFINSHKGSEANLFMSCLSRNKRIQNFKGMSPFNHPEDLKKLTDKRHKCDNSAAIYMHGLWENIDWVRFPVRRLSKFIHLIREPRSSLSNMLEQHLNSKNKIKNLEQNLLNEYCFRLRGIYEMYKLTPKSLVFDIERIDFDQIKEYLNIDELGAFELPEHKDIFPENLCKQAEETYEKYFSLLNL